MQQLVELALKQRVLMMIAAVALLVWGGYSFTQLPIEAYPDVMNAQVQVITQWPGHAAEEVEKLVTVPLETSLNGVPGVQSVRSRSLFGLSVEVGMDFSDMDVAASVAARCSGCRWCTFSSTMGWKIISPANASLNK